MSEAFRCDGCDELFGGRPAARIKVNPASGMRKPLRLGHSPGVTDAHPDGKSTREVEWPYHRPKVQFCVHCAADHICPAVIEAAQEGRYADSEDDVYRCTECGHEATAEEIDGKPKFTDCHECGANGNHRGYYPVWFCPNCGRGYAGSRPTAGNGGVRGCNRCFIGVPINHLRESVEEGNAEDLRRFLPEQNHQSG